MHANLGTWRKNVLGAWFALVLAGACCLCGAGMAYAETGTVTIMHTNDMHGYVDYKDGSCIGLSPLKALVDQQNPDLLLDAGDTFHGQSFATVTQGSSIGTLMDALGYDAMTPGNHDWSYGAGQLQSLDSAYYFGVLAANVVNKSGGSYFEQQYIVKDITLDGGATLKVGVLGVIDQDFYTSTAPANVADVTFEDPVAHANQVAQTLKEQEGCDIVIALTHNKDPQGFAAQTSNIDAVIAGHEHVLMDEKVENAAGTEIPVVEASYYLKNAGVLTLSVDYEKAADGSAQGVTCTGSSETALSPADAAGKSDVTVDALIASIKSLESTILNEPCGTSTQEYPYSWEDIRTSDQALGHAITAAYLNETKADIAFENAGGIRAGIPAGTITAGNMLSISPYGNTLSTYQMTGFAILGMIEHSLEISEQCNMVYDQQKQAIAEGQDPYQYAWPDNSGSVLVAGGVTLVIDRSQPEGGRVVSASVNGQPLDRAKTYTVAMNSYIPTLTSEYGQLSSATLVGEWGTCEQVLRSFVSDENWESSVYPLSGTVTYTTLYPLWVGGVQVTSQNMSDVLGDGTVSFDPTATQGLATYGNHAPLGTLTLNGANIASSDDADYRAGIYADAGLLVNVVAGSVNKVTAGPARGLSCGIQAKYQLIITGGGQLDVLASQAQGDNNSYGIDCGATYNEQTQTFSGGDLLISGSVKVTAVGGGGSLDDETSSSVGVMAMRSLTVQDSAQLFAQGAMPGVSSQGSSMGIAVMDPNASAIRSARSAEDAVPASGAVIVRDKAVVEGRGGSGLISFGMYAAGVDVIVQDEANLRLYGGPATDDVNGSIGLKMDGTGKKLYIQGGSVLLSADSGEPGVPSTPLQGEYLLPAGYELTQASSGSGLTWSIAQVASDGGTIPASGDANGSDAATGATSLAKTGDGLGAAANAALLACALAAAAAAGCAVRATTKKNAA